MALAGFLLTTACGGSIGAGALRVEPLPATITGSCQHPAEFAGAGDWEIMAGRLSDELIACNARRAEAVTAYVNLRKALG